LSRTKTCIRQKLLINCGNRLFFDLCTTSLRLSKQDTAYFEPEISAEIDRQQTSSDPKVFCAAFATPGVYFDFVRNLLTFCQAGKPRPFNGADVNKHIGSTIIGLDKAKTLLTVEPLDSTCRHFVLQSISRATIHAIPFNWSMSLENSPQASSKGTAANRILMTYWFSQRNARNLTRGKKLSSHWLGRQDD
jgi:hypothetical protein